MIEKFKLTGTPTFTLYDANGDIKLKFTKNNMIVSSGKQWIIERLSATPPVDMEYIAIGSNNTNPLSANTSLIDEITRTSFVAVYGANSMTFTATFGPGVGTGTIGEAGVFNNVVGGTMLSRIACTPFTKSAVDTLSIEWVFELI